MTISDYYDENGNIQELETLVQIKWNYRDKLRSGVTVKRVLGIDDEEYYVYDAEGNRIRKVEEKYIDLFTTRVTEKIYINNVEIKKIYTKIFMGSTTQELKRTTLHVMDDTRRIATVHNWTQDDNLREINATGELNTNKIRYQYGNHINSASLELSSTGAIISYEEYFPYGDTSLIAGTAQKEVKLKEYRYTGKEKDDATGLYYYGARYYASWLGRWMSADPLFRENPAVYDRPKGGSAEEQQQQHEEYMQKLYGEGLNMYCYVKGNPVTFSDPSGLKVTEAAVNNINNGANGNYPDKCSKYDKPSQENKGTGKSSKVNLTKQYKDAANKLTKVDGTWQMDFQGAKIQFNKTAEKKAAEYGMTMQEYAGKLDKKMIGLLSEMIGAEIGDNKLKIKSIMISATYYEYNKTENGKVVDRSAGHKTGTAVDIIQMTFKNSQEKADFNDVNNNLPENSSTKAIFNWLADRKDVKDVYSPWQIKSQTYNIKDPIQNVWDKPNDFSSIINKVMKDHRHHLHLRLK